PGMPRDNVEAIIAVLNLQYEFAKTGQEWDEYAAAREKLAARLGNPPDTIPGTPDHPHWESFGGRTSTIPYRPSVRSECRRCQTGSIAAVRSLSTHFGHGLRRE